MNLTFDNEHIWHPYTSIRNPLKVYGVDFAEGVNIHLLGGETLVDGMSSWWAAVHGYNHHKLNEAIKCQLSKMSHVMFGGFTHEPAILLGEKLLSLVPKNLTKIFYCDSGSVSVEIAMKMAIQYWNAKGIKRHKFATVRCGYHGDTWNAMSVCDFKTGMHHIFGGSLPAQYFADAPKSRFGGNYIESDTESIETIFKENNDIAAFIIEPIVQGAGAMRFYHPEYLKRIKLLCEKYNVLLILDEIATGFGRTGKMFACEWSNVNPDIMCIGKALTGGYLSFAATLASDDVANTISNGETGVFMHGPTFMANPLACAVSLESINLLEETNYKHNVERIESFFEKEFLNIKNFKSVEDVRTLGAIGVAEMKRSVDVEKIQRQFVDLGAWIRPFGKLVYLMPPFIINDSQLAILTNAIKKVFEKDDFYE